MTAYREPFPRRRLWLFTAITIAIAASGFVLPGGLLATRRGWEVFRTGGWEMVVLMVLAVLVAAATALLGAFAVRGRRAPMVVLLALPVIPVACGALLMKHAMGHALRAIEDDAVDAVQAMHILAQGMADAQAYSSFGCFIGASAFGAAAVALLGGAASLDDSQSRMPKDVGWVAVLGLGVLGVLVAVGIRIATRGTFGLALLGVPVLILGTILACAASRRGALVGGWRDRVEANAWLGSVLGAAIAGAVAVALLDMTAASAVESADSSTMSGDGVLPSQRIVLLVDAARAMRAGANLAWTDGTAFFAIASAGLVSALAYSRAREGVRSLLGPALLTGIWAVIAVVACLAGVRAWTLAAVDRASARGLATARVAPTVDLPRVSDHERLEPGRILGPTLVVNADGSFQRRGDLTGTTQNIVLAADRRAPWSSVVAAIRATLAPRLPASSLPRLTIRIAAPPRGEPSELGRYAVFLGPDAASIAVRLDARNDNQGRRLVPVEPKATDDMDAVLALLSATGVDRAAVLLPPDGAW